MARPFASSSKATLVQAFHATDRFDSTQDEQFVIDGKDNYADIDHFAVQIEALFSTNAGVVSAAKAVRTNLQQVVIGNETNNGVLPAIRYPNNRWEWVAPGGLSIYLPLNPEDNDWKRSHYHQLRTSQEHSWDEFLTAFWEGVAAPNEPDCGDTCEIAPGPLAVGAIEIFLPFVAE